MKKFIFGTITLILIVTALLTGCVPPRSDTPGTTSSSESESGWQDSFDFSACTLTTTGRNDYFILEPGFQLILKGGTEELVITVLDETINVDGIETRVVEEREWRNGELIEVSRNFFAICVENKDVFYFGEDVDMYKGGKLDSHSGQWRAGENGARSGLMMPGKPTPGMKYYQEIAPDVAMDRAEVISLNETLQTPAGSFDNLLKTQEGTALNPLEREFKTYAPGIGLIQDQNLLLSGYGFVR